MDYEDFLASKSHVESSGFEPVWMPPWLFDFQEMLVDWAVRQGRGLLLTDCGTGKTPMQLVWAENVIRRTNRPVLILTPLAVSYQTVREAEKFDIEAARSSDGTVHPNITVTNYERLGQFDPNDFAGLVCDESSAIKHFGTRRQAGITQFMKKLRYRLLCTATAAPNDYIELGTSSEALGQLGRMDFLSTFFKNDENSNHPIWWGAKWRFKEHARKIFWRWVCSWARALRKPSDYGFEDGDFALPDLEVREHVVEQPLLPGDLFHMPAVTLAEQRAERKSSLNQRCEKAAEICAAHDRPTISWCHYNPEGDLLTRLIPDARQVHGSLPDEEKEEVLLGFARGDFDHLVAKESYGFGLNLQRCADQTTFPSHSFERAYQSVRRSYRFGQERTVGLDIITTPGEMGVLKNLQRKQTQADKMFTEIVAQMNNALQLDRQEEYAQTLEVPTWLN